MRKGVLSCQGRLNLVRIFSFPFRLHVGDCFIFLIRGLVEIALPHTFFGQSLITHTCTFFSIKSVIILINKVKGVIAPGNTAALIFRISTRRRETHVTHLFVENLSIFVSSYPTSSSMQDKVKSRNALIL